MLTLTEKYRPRTLDEVVGQPKAVALLDARRKRFGTWAGHAYWIAGPTGVGKTTLAKIIAASIAGASVVECAADTFGASEMDDLEREAERVMRGLPGFGLVLILNEAHGLRAAIIRRLHVLIERVQEAGANIAIVFTTTLEGEEEMFADSIEQRPLLTRCSVIRLTAQGTNKPFAARAAEIARAEGVCLTEAALSKLAYECKSSMRGLLRAIEDAPLAVA